MSNLRDLVAGVLEEVQTLPDTQTPAPHRLSQSLIKPLTDEFHCPVRVYLVDMTETHKRKETESMRGGQLFEYLSVGSLTREGNIPSMTPLTKKGKHGNMSTDEFRIREQASKFAGIMAENGIELIQKEVKIKTRYSPELDLDGIIDFRARVNGKATIVDVKLTADIHDTFGYYSFGDEMLFDDIQAQLYMMIEYMNYGVRIPFKYAVFDYKKNSEYKFIDRELTDFSIMETKNRIQKALETLKQYKASPPLNDYRPGYQTCMGCPVPCDLKVTSRPKRS